LSAARMLHGTGWPPGVGRRREDRHPSRISVRTGQAIDVAVTSIMVPRPNRRLGQRLAESIYS
jgi:hypothetical protein